MTILVIHEDFVSAGVSSKGIPVPPCDVVVKGVEILILMLGPDFPGMMRKEGLRLTRLGIQAIIHVLACRVTHTLPCDNKVWMLQEVVKYLTLVTSIRGFLGLLLSYMCIKVEVCHAPPLIPESSANNIC